MLGTHFSREYAGLYRHAGRYRSGRTRRRRTWRVERDLRQIVVADRREQVVVVPVEGTLIPELHVVRTGHVARRRIPGVREDVSRRPVRGPVFQVAAYGQTVAHEVGTRLPSRSKVAAACSCTERDSLSDCRVARSIPTARYRFRIRLRATACSWPARWTSPAAPSGASTRSHRSR